MSDEQFKDSAPSTSIPEEWREVPPPPVIPEDSVTPGYSTEPESTVVDIPDLPSPPPFRSPSLEEIAEAARTDTPIVETGGEMARRALGIARNAIDLAEAEMDRHDIESGMYDHDHEV